MIVYPNTGGTIIGGDAVGGGQGLGPAGVTGGTTSTPDASTFANPSPEALKAEIERKDRLIRQLTDELGAKDKTIGSVTAQLDAMRAANETTKPGG